MTLLGRAGYGHCRVAGVLARLANDGSSTVRQIPFAGRGQLAVKRARMYEVHLTSTQPLFLSESDQIPLINRFLLMDSTGITVGVGEMVRKEEMRLPLRILSKTRGQDDCPWSKQTLDPHFIVQAQAVTVLTIGCLEAVEPHLLWLDDGCSYTDAEHSVIRTAVHGGATVLATFGSLVRQDPIPSSIGSHIRSPLCRLLEDCGFALVEICRSAAALPTESRLSGHKPTHKAAATKVPQVACRRRPALASRPALSASALEEVFFPDDFPDEVRW